MSQDSPEPRILHCLRCHHNWPTKKKGKALPKVCPKCASPYWNKMYSKRGYLDKNVEVRAFREKIAS